MPKASRILAALKRDGWVEIRRSGSHRTLERRGRRVTWAHHRGDDLGNAALSRLAKTFGYTLDELRRIL
jgi:predicted RNA binding protein YcfA (HicA-like mRNA interferase family)